MASSDGCNSLDDTCRPEALAKTRLVLVGHGSRVSNVHLEQLATRLSASMRDVDVALGYLEHASPTVSDALDQAAFGADRVCVLPLFLFDAGHTQRDLPQLVEAARRRYPRVQFEVGPAFDLDRGLVAIAASRVATAVPKVSEIDLAGVLLVGRGSSVDIATTRFLEVGEALQSRLRVPVKPCFLAAQSPAYSAVVATILERPGWVVAPYLLFPGKLTRVIQQGLVDAVERSGMNPKRTPPVARCLGVEEDFAVWLSARVRELLLSAEFRL